MNYSLKDYYHAEINGSDKTFSWVRVLWKASRSRQANYLFWWRIASRLHRSRIRLVKSIGKSINRRISRRHGMEIMLGAQIGPGLNVGHMIGNVIAKNLIAGKCLQLRQNTNIGTDFKGDWINAKIIIGDHVSIGTNTCIIASGLKIGDHVKIGAMSFVREDIPDHATFVTVKESRIIIRKDNS
jgi:serine O-acetyltransferase